MSATVGYLTAWPNSDWHYYVRDVGDLERSLWPIGEPDEFVCEQVWMRPVAASSLDESDREGETLTRDARGRFASVVVWIECREESRGAERWYGARYAPSVPG